MSQLPLGDNVSNEHMDALDLSTWPCQRPILGALHHETIQVGLISRFGNVKELTRKHAFASPFGFTSNQGEKGADSRKNTRGPQLLKLPTAYQHPPNAAARSVSLRSSSSCRKSRLGKAIQKTRAKYKAEHYCGCTKSISHQLKKKKLG